MKNKILYYLMDVLEMVTHNQLETNMNIKLLVAAIIQHYIKLLALLMKCLGNAFQNAFQGHIQIQNYLDVVNVFNQNV